MEKQPIKRKLKKADLIFFLILAAAALICIFWYQYRYQTRGNQVEITVDGTAFGTYSLKKDAEIPIETGENVTNILSISDGMAKMISADCKDQLCVRQKAVGAVGETIVCLPNKVVVTVTGSEDTVFDSIVK